LQVAIPVGVTGSGLVLFGRVATVADASTGEVRTDSAGLVVDADVVAGATVLPPPRARTPMVTTTERDGMTWYECEVCGMLFDDRSDAQQHEDNCDSDSADPSYLQ
jgi:hypothetical protein